MTRVCEKYRERALRDGLNSPAGEIWRSHSRNCPQCRTEIYLLGMLGESVSDCRQHICRKEYERLLEEVRVHSAAVRPLRCSGKNGRNLHFAGQIAAVLCVFFVIALSGSWSRYELGEDGGLSSEVVPTERQLTAASLEDHFFDFSSFITGHMPGVFAAAEPSGGDSSYMQKDELFWDSSVERAFFELRNDIEEQNLFYSGMIDRELQE